MNALKLAAVTIFHPMVAFTYMKKDRTKYDWRPVLVILALLIFAKIFSLYFTHYPLQSVDIKDANLVIECAVVVVPLLSWVLASYAITTILDGEVKLTECLTACCYSMLPYVYFIIPLTICTHLMDSGSAGTYSTIMTVAYVWILINMIVNLKVMNNYTVGKTVLVIILSLFTMVMLWAVVFLFYALSMRFVSFVAEVVQEIQFRIYY